jgi:hypothetical protein
MVESRAIARYIDATAGNKLSHHNNLSEFGKVETWASVEAFNFDKYASGKNEGARRRMRRRE